MCNFSEGFILSSFFLCNSFFHFSFLCSSSFLYFHLFLNFLLDLSLDFFLFQDICCSICLLVCENFNFFGWEFTYLVAKLIVSEKHMFRCEWPIFFLSKTMNDFFVLIFTGVVQFSGKNSETSHFETWDDIFKNDFVMIVIINQTWSNNEIIYTQMFFWNYRILLTKNLSL